jgi:hypothetical protein
MANFLTPYKRKHGVAAAGDANVTAPVAPIAAASAAPPSASLHVGDLNEDVREEHLFEIFSVVGPIDSIRVLRDHISRVSLGSAYVNFSSAQDAERALETLNHHVLKGTPLSIKFRNKMSPVSNAAGAMQVHDSLSEARPSALKLHENDAPPSAPSESSTASVLEKKLERRPSLTEVKQQRIFMDIVQAKTDVLSHARAADAVGRCLARRPSLTELQQTNILKTPLQAKAQALQLAQAADALQKTLANRPSVEQLKQQNIVSTSVQATAQSPQIGVNVQGSSSSAAALHAAAADHASSAGFNFGGMPAGEAAGHVVHRKCAASNSTLASVCNSASAAGESSAPKPFPMWLLVPIVGVILLMFYKLN